MPIAVALLIVGVPLLVIDLVIGVLLAGVVSGASWLAIRGTKTTGEIVRIGEKQGTGRYTRFRASYVTPEGTFETGGITERPQLGEPVDVRYHRSRPSFATTETRPLRQAVTGVPMVVLVAVVGIGMIVSAIWFFSGSHTQLQLPMAGASFSFALMLAFAYYATSRYTMLLGWRHMVQTEGKVLRHDEPPAGKDGPVRLLISFQSADGDEEFRAAASTVHARAGDNVTVYYDPSKPAATATVQDAPKVRSAALGSTAFAVLFGALGVIAIVML